MKKKSLKKKVVARQSVIPALNNPFSTETSFKEPGKFIVIYAPPGEGKTTVAAHAPSPLFIHTSDEQGIKQAITAGVVPSDLRNWLIELEPVFDVGNIPADSGHPGWMRLIDTIHLFEKGEHDRRTVIIDTTSGVESLCHQHTASLLFKGDMVKEDGFMSFYKGYRKAAEQFWQQELMTACSRCVAKGYNVILLAHSSLSNEPNPAGPDFQMYSPDLDKRIWDATKKAVQGILFMGRCQSLKKDKMKTKVSAEHRFIGINRETWYEAKNWFNFQEPIDVGASAAETWDNINAVLKFQ